MALEWQTEECTQSKRQEQFNLHEKWNQQGDENQEGMEIDGSQNPEEQSTVTKQEEGTDKTCAPQYRNVKSRGEQASLPANIAQR